MEFTQKHHLDRHLNGHTRNNCTICNAQFTKRKALCKHLKTDHSICEPEKLYHCSFCEKHFSKRPSLNAHLKHHAEGRLLCIKCGFMCKNENAFSDHMKDHLKNSKYECMLCEKKFVRRQQYNQHMMGHERHVCSLCDMTFSTKKLLLKHQQSTHGARVTEKKHECPVCKKLFLRPKHLQIHQRCHTGEKPVKCSHCEKSFCNDRALSKHMKTVRHLQRVNVDEGKNVEIEKPFLCAECGATFYRQQSLLRHIEIQHTTSESLKCEHCEYSTKCKANLKRHSELHTDKRRFICEICGSSFRALATLKEHHVYVHSENRSFVCSICNKAFKSKSSLQRHLRIHSEVRPYKCHCSRDYKRMSHLKRHMISAHCMTFKRNFSYKTEESSDTEINIGNQNATPNETEMAEVLQKQSSSSNDFPLFISTNHLFDHEKLSEIVIDKNINEEHISSTPVEEDNYTNVPSRNMQSFLAKPGDNILTNSSENALMTFISQSDVHSQQVSLPSPSANSKDRNSVSLDDSNLNLSPSSYCNFSLSSSSLSSFIETVPSNLQAQSTSHGVLTLTSAQDNLNRPHSLPNLNFENQAANIDSFAHFSLHNRDSPSPSVSISSFLLNEMPSSPQLPDLNLEHNTSTKQLFEDTDDILTMPQYTSSHLGVTGSPTHLFSQSRNSGFWDDTSNRLKISGNDVIASNSCANIVSSMTNFSDMPPNTNNILSHNLIFSNDSLIPCSNYANSSDFEIV
ncbi:Zinc finger protein 41, partial [Stegodyphus mimosarum]